LVTGRGILADFWVPHEIESCNFQNLLVFGFPETSQNLISFRQLLFSLFQNQSIQNPQKSAKIAPSCGQDDLVLCSGCHFKQYTKISKMAQEN
jgi:hypothetical protein